MIMNSKRTYFSADKYRLLAKNPFIDRKMLQFVKDRTLDAPAGGMPAATSACRGVQGAKPVISDEAAKLIAAAIRGLLRE